MRKLSLTSFPIRPLSAACLLMAALTAPLAHAQATAGPMPAHQRGAGMQQRALQSVGASAAQQTQIGAILQQAHSDVKLQRQAAGALRKQLAQVLAAATVDATAAETLRQQIAAQEDASSLRMLQAHLQVAAVLTPDQRQKLLALNQQQHQQWQGRHAAGA